MQIEVAALKETLPNFPAEVLEEWLLPYALSEGWPPAPSGSAALSGRWRYLLKNQPLDYWRSMEWSMVERHVSIHDLDSEFQKIMVQMVLGAIQGQFNLYSSQIKDLTPRFNRIKEHFSQFGTHPKPPALLAEPHGLTIADGNHRMAAYLYCYGYFNLDLDASLQLKTKEIQSYWVGKPNPSFNTDWRDKAAPVG